MSKLSFRARALDAAKPLPIYRGKDMPDLNDCVSINRAVPQMPTGMEKEEESEHHLQRAISAQQVFREKKESMVIPVPEAESNVNYYNRLYKGEFKQPKQFIHIQRKFVDSLFSVCNLSLSTSEYPFFSMPKEILIFQFMHTD
ncbi:enhancer of polycomb homolog 2 [Lynx canadensis]|uniref:Enhancer of polycomb homolog n=1 Tax=Lynx canadensis TaxID=61383 RepID=A0A667H563_LYNCA|nr:enhancer of polycomb homolog 2 [Lynx canadensis]